MTALSHADIERFRHARSPRELSAVLAEVEPRLGREVTVGDLEELVTGHHGRTVQRKTATFVRQLPGWGGAGALYRLEPELLAGCGETVAHAIAIVHQPEDCVSRYGRPGEVTITLHPATACGATFGGVRFAGSPPRDAVGWREFTRWRDELAAAEPVRRVARWSEADGLYRLDPPHEYQIGDGDCRAYLVSRVQAIAWGYEIEGSPIRKVARWDATRGAYVALDAHGTVCMITTERAQAIDWGYDPEGGPEPVRDWKSDRAIAAIWPIQPAEDSPERLRERREALGLSVAEMADRIRERTEVTP